MTDLNKLLMPSSVKECEEYAVENLILSIQIAIQKVMNEKGVSRKELAERLNLSEARISQMLSSNGVNLTLKSVGKIANALEEEFEFVSKDDLKKIRSKPTALQEMSEIPARRLSRKAKWLDETANANRFPFEYEEAA